MLSTDLTRIKQAITKTQGNLMRAAGELGISKQYIMVLARRYELNDWARELRIQHGHPPAGNPLLPVKITATL